TVNTGRVRILRSNGAVPAAFLIFAYKNNGVTVTEASVIAAEPTYGLRMYAENNLPLVTGIAVAAGDQGAFLNVQLFDAAGQPTPYSGVLGIPPDGQI